MGIVIEEEISSSFHEWNEISNAIRSDPFFARDDYFKARSKFII